MFFLLLLLPSAWFVSPCVGKLTKGNWKPLSKAIIPKAGRLHLSSFSQYNTYFRELLHLEYFNLHINTFLFKINYKNTYLFIHFFTGKESIYPWLLFRLVANQPAIYATDLNFWFVGYLVIQKKIIFYKEFFTHFWK